MALDPSNVRVAVTGALYHDKTGEAAAPTGTADALAVDYADLGYASEDGVTLTMPGSGDSEPIRAWQNGAKVRTIRTPNDDNPQVQVTLIETKLEVIEAVFGVTVAQTATEGSFEFSTDETREPTNAVLDVVDGAELIRIHMPRVSVAEIGDISLTSTGAIGYPVTFDLELDPTTGYNFKSWMTALAEPES